MHDNRVARVYADGLDLIHQCVKRISIPRARRCLELLGELELLLFHGLALARNLKQAFLFLFNLSAPSLLIFFIPSLSLGLFLCLARLLLFLEPNSLLAAAFIVLNFHFTKLREQAHFAKSAKADASHTWAFGCRRGDRSGLGFVGFALNLDTGCAPSRVRVEKRPRGKVRAATSRTDKSPASLGTLSCGVGSALV